MEPDWEMLLILYVAPSVRPVGTEPVVDSTTLSFTAKGFSLSLIRLFPPMLMLPLLNSSFASNA